MINICKYNQQITQTYSIMIVLAINQFFCQLHPPLVPDRRKSFRLVYEPLQVFSTCETTQSQSRKSPISQAVPTIQSLQKSSCTSFSLKDVILPSNNQ